MVDIVFDKYPVVELDAFLPEILLEIPELPEDIAMHFIREAAIEFSVRTHVVQRKVKICKEDCIDDYILEPPDCTRLVMIHSICGCGCCSGVTRLTGKPCTIGCGNYAWFEEPNIIYITGSAGIYEVIISVAPKRDACEVPAVLYESYKYDVQTGALWKLYDIARRPWSSIAAAQNKRLEFDRRIAAASIDRLFGKQAGPVKMQTRRIM